MAIKTPEGYINIQFLTSAGRRKKVYIGFHVLTRTWMVLKRFIDSPTEDEIAQDLRPLLAKLNHRNIVRQEHPQTIGSSVWLIEERLDATFETLAPIDNRYQYALFALHIAEGLDYIHRLPKPVVHGDIHLGNCGVVNGIGKLLDFGRATYAHDSRRLHGGGYICIRPPEFFPHGGMLTEQYDVWALGCTLYGLRTGEYPFVTKAEYVEFEKNRGRKSLEAEIQKRVTRGLSDATARRFEALFDSKLWRILGQTLQGSENRIAAKDLVAQLKSYREISEQSLRPVQADVQAMKTYGRQLLNNGKVAKLSWFEDQVSLTPGRRRRLSREA